jgi:nitrite reductase (NADH) small subunit/3-phenylpropionate/trans-cinnamate dioxygenase ferredoxin subunit
MAEYETVACVGDIPEGEGRAYTLNGRMIAVFNDQGEFRATDDLCPHMGAPLSDGYILEGAVVCPWHAWRFCMQDGGWTDNPELKIDVFDLKLDGEDIQVLVPEKDG